MRSAALIYNPAAGNRQTPKLVASIRSILAEAGWSLHALPTHAPGAAEDLARRAASESFDAVLAFGGDGTLRECAAGLLGSATALGFIPGGTTNVMSLTFGLPNRPLEAARLLARGRTGEMDVGLAGDTPFLMQISAGIDAALMAALRPPFKKFLGRASVVPAAVEALSRYRFPEFEVRVDGRGHPARLAIVSNISFYGGRWKIAPEARLDDRSLHVVLFRGRRWKTLSWGIDVFLGRHLRRGDVQLMRAAEVTLPGIKGLIAQTDGDVLTDALPATVRLSPHRLRLLLPDR